MKADTFDQVSVKSPFVGTVPVLSAEQLVAAGRIIEPPFSIVVRHDGQDETLVFKKILRLLPGKRIVGVAHVKGEDLLIKAYLGRAAKRYARRENIGVGLIALSGVRTPALKWRGRLTHGRGEVLAFEYLRDAISLFDRWQEAQREDARVEVLTRAMVIIGKLHNQGVVQNDIHLANFLVANGKLYTIDGGDIVKRSHPPLPEAPSLHNLGMFFAQFYPRYDDLIEVVLPAYEVARGWEMRSSRVAALARETVYNRERRKRLCLNKAFRECTRFICNNTFVRYEVCERGDFDKEMQALIHDPDRFINKSELLKDGATSTVALVHLSNRSVVIKRYNLKSLWHRIRRSVRNTRAWTSWANACRMEFLGIPSVKPVALIENRFGPLRGTSYFVTEYIEGEDALKCLRSLKHHNGELEALARILQDLSDSRISHGDLKATNFVMSKEGPHILDLDAMREHSNRQSFNRAFKRDIERFMQNWHDRPELTHRFKGLLSSIAP